MERRTDARTAGFPSGWVWAARRRAGRFSEVVRRGRPGGAGGGAAGYWVFALVVAIRAATVSQPWCQAESRWKAPFMPNSASL